MVLHTFESNRIPIIKAEPLTIEGFAPFGSIISPNDQVSTTNTASANQGTAQKVRKVAPIINSSEGCPSGIKASANWNIFRCNVPQHLIQENIYTAKVLERHPYSNQTFLPMGNNEQDSYLVICALNDPSTTDYLPDPSSIKAFICNGDQAVNYGMATWHAPMIVLEDTVNFAVLIHENGVEEEDCQECYFNPGFKIQF